MPRAKTPTPAGSAELNATVARVAPAILDLLADNVPRSKAAIIEALAGRHEKQDVTHALIRLAVTGQIEEAGGKVRAGRGVTRVKRRLIPDPGSFDRWSASPMVASCGVEP